MHEFKLDKIVSFICHKDRKDHLSQLINFQTLPMESLSWTTLLFPPYNGNGFTRDAFSDNLKGVVKNFAEEMHCTSLVGLA